MAQPNLTERQRKWFASVRESLERDTGRTMAEWVDIARTCPETGHRARLKWFKETHGLLQNRASQVVSEAFGSTMSWQAPDDLTAALWTAPDSRAIYDAVAVRCAAIEGTIPTARKGYSAWSRTVQFAALRPLKGGRAVLGLALTADADPRLEARGSESWSERLTAKLRLDSPDDLDATIEALLAAAAERS